MSSILKKSKEENLQNQIGQEEKNAEKLSNDQLDQVNGAGNPFEDIPRVPTQNIDDDLRNNV